jgi:hypothetical protein
MHLAQRRGATGTLRAVWSWSGAVADVTLDGEALQVRLLDGGEHVHARTEHGWHVALVAGGAHSGIDLGGVREPAPAPAPAATTDVGSLPPVPSPDAPLCVALGEPHYRRSELSWRDAGAPTARVRLHVHGERLVFGVAVATTAPSFMPAGAVNDMDNERADVNGDGVQLHLAARGASGVRPATASWLLVPELAGGLRVVALEPGAAAGDVVARWAPTDDGYRIAGHASLGALRAAAGGAPVALGLDVLVNESAPGRERRRGQLVLGGARGEFVYLRGDRHDPARLLWFRLPDV